MEDDLSKISAVVVVEYGIDIIKNRQKILLSAGGGSTLTNITYRSRRKSKLNIAAKM